jgi:HPr kinase/phosphorylase
LSGPAKGGATRSSVETRPPGLRVADLIGDDALGLPLEVIAGRIGLDRQVKATRIQKSGLALAGHFHGIEPNRIQILGVTEMTYLEKLRPERCEATIRRYLDLDLCAVVVTEMDQTMRGESMARAALVRAADECDTPLLVTSERSSRTILALHGFLDERLAPRQRVHGVLVDVFEVGLLMLGSSGVGKSEVALELVMRGHRLVADDVVECQYRPPGMVFGTAADLLRHHLEVRGLGILNIKNLFGVTSVRDRKRIDVVVRLVETTGDSDHDRLGLDQRAHRLLGVDIPELQIPVRPGRDMASILEIAARNELLKQAGFNPAAELVGRVEGSMRAKSESEFPGPATSARPASSSPAMPSNRPPESSVGLPVRKRK